MMSSREQNAPHRRLLARSMSLVGWDRIRESLASFALSPATRDHCLALVPEDDPSAARRALEETAEMTALLDSVESPPFTGFDDLGPIFKGIDEKHVLDPPQALALLKLLRLTRSLRRYFTRQNESPHLEKLGEGLDPLTPLAKELERCIDKDGEIRDNASPELRRAIRETAAAKDKLTRTIGGLLRNPRFNEALQDTYHTERDGRLVFPVRAEWRSRVEGIVHDTSGSGATVYMEPIQIVQLNNQLKIRRLKIEQEKLKVLRHLAEETAAHRETLTLDFDILAALDMIHARARLARGMQAVHCPMNLEGRVHLRRARNPELILDGREVVANDIAWDPGVRVIIVSGPNTGGKTVTLKTIGLMSLMARAGLFLPVAENSAIGFFPEIHADIGDGQSIQLDLSTFSAHLVQIIKILEEAAPGSLLLLDELGISTDPEEGAALAESILIELKQRGMMTLVSTHYVALKYLAQTQEGFCNACTEFDPQTLRPTYRLIFGVPGNSAALDTAQRLGLPAAIIGRARKIFLEKDSDSNSLLQNLNRQLLEAVREKEQLARKNGELESLRREQKEIAEKMRRELCEFQKDKARQLQAYVREGKKEIRRMIEEAKGKKTLPHLRRTEKQIHARGRPPAADAPVPEGWDVPVEQLTPGDPVLVVAYGTRGVLLDDPRGKKRVRIRAGHLEMEVKTERLRGSARDRSHPPSRITPAPPVTIHVESPAKAEVSCNLHGMRFEEAQRTLEKFINQAAANRAEKITVIHGHGTGVLRNMVRDYLEKYGIGTRWRPGVDGEGGDAVTVIEFR